MKALLIVDHGSRSKAAHLTFMEIIERVREKMPSLLVEGAHMEIVEPSVFQVVEELVQKGVTDIQVVPYFLYKGFHVEKSIPTMIKALSETYSYVNFRITEPIGTEPLLADIIVNRAKKGDNGVVK